MNPIQKQKNELLKSIQNNDLTVYSGVFTTTKNYIVKEFIKEMSNEYNCIVLNFSILHLKRYYSSKSNYEYITKNLDDNKMNLIIIFEFTHCDDWITLIEKIQLTKNTKILATTSIDFSSYLSFSKIKQFRVLYNEIVYYPPTYSEFMTLNPKATIQNYLTNGSITIPKEDGEYNEENMAMLSELNILRLFNIFLITTKVRNYFHLEIFFSFLIKNMDQKLTLDFIRKNINKRTDLVLKNIKSFWKYINLLQSLYIILPIWSYSFSRRQKKMNSKFVCIDHMLFKNIKDSDRNLQLIFRNILLLEFVKRKNDILILEDQTGAEIGYLGITSRETKILMIFEKTSLISEFIKREKIDEENIYFFPKKFTEEWIENFLKELTTKING